MLEKGQYKSNKRNENSRTRTPFCPHILPLQHQSVLHICATDASSVCVSHPDSVSLSQSYRVGQFDLDLSAVEGPKDTQHLQQTIIQPAEKQVCLRLLFKSLMC